MTRLEIKTGNLTVNIWKFQKKKKKESGRVFLWTYLEVGVTLVPSTKSLRDWFIQFWFMAKKK